MDERYAVYNPNNKPVEELPVIYGFNNGGSREWYQGEIIAQDGTFLGSHICSHEGFMYGDLGVLAGSRSDRHEDFKKHYPDGYRMDFVSYNNAKTHEGLQMAFANNKALPEEKKTEGDGFASVKITVAN